MSGMKKLGVIMSIKIYLSALLLFFPACVPNNPQLASQEKSTLLIQEISDSPLVSSLIKRITPIINDIIKQELGLDQEYDFEFFLPKELQRITLYYVNDIPQEVEMVLLRQLEKMKLHDQKVENVFFTSKVEFFGNQHDELVVMINDSEEELLELNQKIKKSLQLANNEYEKINNQALYNIEKSEWYPFLPHMGLGRIRLQSIKNQIKDESQVMDILEQIKQKIKNVTVKIIKELLLPNHTLSFYRIGVLDLQKRTYIKEWIIPTVACKQ